MIKALIFDFAGVITKTDGFWTWLSAHVKGFENKRVVLEKLSFDVDRGNIRHDEFVAGLASAAGVPKEIIWNEIKKSYEINQELLAIIIKLKKNYKTAILSNFTYPWISEFVEELDLNSYFDRILVSSREKIAKPDYRFFEMALNALQVKPDEAIFFDDREANVLGAKAAGMPAFVFTTNDTFKKNIASYRIHCD